jgi:hypothetical protein
MSNEHKKRVTIIVNGQEKIVDKEKISYEEVVVLAFGTAPGAQAAVTVVYIRGEGGKPEGSLVSGQEVNVKDNMIFNVTSTDRS